MKKLIFTVIAGLLLTGCSNTPQGQTYPFCEKGYSISIDWGADKWAGTDYEKAKEMANGNPIYENSGSSMPCVYP